MNAVQQSYKNGLIVISTIPLKTKIYALTINGSILAAGLILIQGSIDPASIPRYLINVSFAVVSLFTLFWFAVETINILHWTGTYSEYIPKPEYPTSDERAKSMHSVLKHVVPSLFSVKKHRFVRTTHLICLITLVGGLYLHGNFIIATLLIMMGLFNRIIRSSTRSMCDTMIEAMSAEQIQMLEKEEQLVGL